MASLLLIHDLYPVDARDARAARRSTRCGPTWSPTAATSSCSGSTTASRACGCREAATAAPRRGRRSSSRSSRRWTSTRPIWPGWRSRAWRSRGRGASSCRWCTPGGPSSRSSTATATRANGGGSSWVALDGANGLEAGRLRRLDAEGVALVVANVDGSLLAYRNACAGCGAALDTRRARRPDAALHRMRRRVRSAPRRPRGGDEPLQLAPIPLLDDGRIRVAV